MRRYSKAALLALLLAAPARAGQVTLTCDNNVPEATGYRLYQSTDMGSTWTKIADVAKPTTGLVQFVIQAPEGTLILYKSTAYNTAAESRQWRGAWYDARLKPLSALPTLGAN